MGKESAAENIKVLVRCRPLSEKEKNSGHKSSVDLDLSAHCVSVKTVVGEADRWTFDAVINNTFTQKDIFTQFILPLVDSVLNGFNATVFAYGQSGSGKTHTMTGVMGNEEMEGVIPRCFKYVFSSLREQQESTPNKSYSMYVSFVELYNGKVRDLLAKQQVTLDVREAKDHTFFVQGVSLPQVKFPEEIIRLMEEGTERRRTASTELNSDSSRSHSLFTLVMECTETSEDGTARSITSKLNLVDLAGSERQGKTGASGDTLKEGCNINLSLSALGTVIDTIVKGRGHVPFRSSPLTMLLKDSLGGNSKTVMFANINPSENNVSETVSTLRFADRAKQIKNKPVVNMDTKDQKIAELSQMVHELREKLKKFETEGVESLESELVSLREKVGELEVSLDNALNGRQADALDYQNANAKLTSEKQALSSSIVEMEERLCQLQSDLHIAESSAKAERAHRESVLEVCTTYLRGGEPIANVDALTMVLKDRAHGANSAELARLQTKYETLKAENHTTRRALKAAEKTLEAKGIEHKQSIKLLERKLKKLTQELESAKAAEVKAATMTGPPAAEGAVTGMSEERAVEIQKTLEQTLAQYNGTEMLATIEQKVSHLQTLHEELRTGVAQELHAAKEQLAQRPEGDDGELTCVQSQMREVLLSSNACGTALLQQVAGAYELLHLMKVAMNMSQAVPLAVLSGDAEAAARAMDEIQAVESSEQELATQLLDRITSEVLHAYQERNRLLASVADAHPETGVDLKKEIRKVIKENELLRRQNTDAISEREAERAKTVARERSIAAKAATSAASAQQATEALRQDDLLKPKELLDAIQADPSGAAAIKSLHEENIALREQVAKCGDLVAAAAKQKLEEALASLEEERNQREVLERARDALSDEMRSLREEVIESEKAVAEVTGKMNELRCEYERKLADAQGSGDEVQHLEARLRERAEQLDQMRDLLDKQKALIVRSNEKVEILQMRLKEANANAAQTEKEFRDIITAKDESIQRAINQRLDEYASSAKKEKQRTTKKSKKAVKKMETELELLRGDFDRKVCECEDLRRALEEQKVDHIRYMRRQEDDDSADVIEQKEFIQNALERAKEERRRKEQQFELGEVKNAKGVW